MINILDKETIHVTKFLVCTKFIVLFQHFKKCGQIHYVTVALKKDPKNPGNFLSMGYGFIQFKHKASADKALKTLQQSVIDGYSLELKRSNRTIQ